MESLEKLSSFLTALCNFSWVRNISMVAKVPPNIDDDLKKAIPKIRLLRFNVEKTIGVYLLKEELIKNKDAIILELRITTYPGCLRVANEKYVQSQLTTKRVLGWPIDILPRKQVKPSRGYCNQILIINSKKVSRFGNPDLTKPIMSEKLRKKIDDFNTKRYRSKKSFNIPFSISKLLGANSIQVKSRI